MDLHCQPVDDGGSYFAGPYQHSKTIGIIDKKDVTL